MQYHLKFKNLCLWSAIIASCSETNFKGTSELGSPNSVTSDSITRSRTQSASNTTPNSPIPVTSDCSNPSRLPPVISNFKIRNTVSQSTTDFTKGDVSEITADFTSNIGLAENPVLKLEISDSSGSFGVFPGITIFPTGKISDKYKYSWNVSLPIPTSEAFQLKIYVQDICGTAVSALTDLKNDNHWSIFAGRFDVLENESSKNIILGSKNDSCKQCLVVLDNNDILFHDSELGIRIIDSTTSNVRTLIPASSGVKPWSSMVLFGNLVYVSTPEGVYRFNPKLKNPDLELYFGGGSKCVGNGFAANELKVSAESSMTFDANGSMFISISCSTATYSQTIAQDGASIYKVDMNSDKKAGVASLVIGTGVQGTPVYGQLAISQPLPCNSLALTQPEVNDDSSALYIQCWGENLLKVVDKKIYKTSISPLFSTYSTLKFNPNDKFFYIGSSTEPGIDPRKGIMKFKAEINMTTPVNESLTIVVGGSESNSCHLDGPAHEQCPLATTGLAFNSTNQLYFIDGTTINTGGMPLKIRRLNGTNVETLAGSFKFNEQLDRRNQWLMSVGDLVQGSNGDIYFPDGGYSRILTVSKNSNVVRNYVGSGNVIKKPGFGEVSRLEIPLGKPYWGGNIAGLGISPEGRLVFRADHRFYQINSSDNVIPYGAVHSSGNSGWAFSGKLFGSTNTSSPSFNPAYVNLGNFNIEFTSDGKLVTLGGYSTSPPQIIKIDSETFSISRIAGVVNENNQYSKLGTEFNNSTADGEIAKGNPFKCNGNTGRDWLVTNVTGPEACSHIAVRVNDRYKKDTIYFSERSSIRYIDKDTGTYQTLTSGLVGTVSNFVIDQNRLYYINSSGSLYCKWLADPAQIPNNCQNTVIQPPVLFPRFSPSPNDGMVMTEDGLLISVGKAIVKYKP